MCLSAGNGLFLRVVCRFPVDADVVDDILRRENGFVDFSSERSADCQIQQQKMRSTEGVEISDAALSGLEGENIAITDTNGNVYHSMMDAQDEMLTRLEENDKYMQQKVNLQLDRPRLGSYSRRFLAGYRAGRLRTLRFHYLYTKQAAFLTFVCRQGSGRQPLLFQIRMACL